MGYLLDTNIVSAILKKNERIIVRLEEVQVRQQAVSISCITFYEIKRGLLAANATKKSTVFEDFCSRISILFLDNLNILKKAAEIHVDLRRRGRPIGDGDILIAATAIASDLILVSNDSDMLAVRELQIDDWIAKNN